MRNKEIADIFEQMGELLEIKGELIFKIRAYYKAAEIIANLSEDIETIRKENRLTEIPGVGKTLAEKISQYLDTGKIAAYEELIKEFPAGLLELVRIPSVGPKKAKLFFDKLNVKCAADLSKAISEGKLKGIAGIKEKTIANIKRGLEAFERGGQRMNLGVASEAAQEFINALKNMPEVKQIQTAGSLRRGRETVRDIDILVESANPAKVMDAFIHLPAVKSINVYGETKSSILTRNNVQVDLRVVEHKSFGAALLYSTGSQPFNVRLRQIAIKKHMKVNEYGIFSVGKDKEKMIAGETEEDCFRAFGLPYIPPELREEIGQEIIFKTQDWYIRTGDARRLPIRRVPDARNKVRTVGISGGRTRRRWYASSQDRMSVISDLIELSDIKGDLHVHSTWSDGHNTIAEMAQAAKEIGYQYLAISDHSPRLHIAGGVSPDDLKEKKKEIDELNKKMKDFHVLFGTEVEIDSEGNLDYNDAILSQFDIVIAAIHSGFEQSSQKMTQRLVAACKNKHVHAIAHPTGVHLGQREPYNFDFGQVCMAAADYNVCLEINAFPSRLDLNGANVYHARQYGVKFLINTDSHRINHMDYMRFGATTARRGWSGKQDVLNTLPYNELIKRLRDKKG